MSIINNLDIVLLLILIALIIFIVYKSIGYNDYFTNLSSGPPYAELDTNVLASKTYENKPLITEMDFTENIQNPNFNTVNNIPLLISPDTKNPNQASTILSKAYYKTSRLQLETNPSSPLLKLQEENLKKINNTVEKCKLKNKNNNRLNGPFDGYNAFDNLGSESYSNVTGIGKSMLTPYSEFPLPS